MGLNEEGEGGVVRAFFNSLLGGGGRCLSTEAIEARDELNLCACSNDAQRLTYVRTTDSRRQQGIRAERIDLALRNRYSVAQGVWGNEERERVTMGGRRNATPET